jgi:small conductance mechanosensitive channel
MYQPMQIPGVDREEIAQADSLFRAGLETRVQSLAHMTWEDRLRLIGNDMWHIGLKLLVVVAIVVVGRWLIKRMVRGVDLLLTKGKIEPSLRSFLNSALKTLSYLILFYIVILWLGINTSLFVALFAAAGLAIGMAMSGVFQNVAGGVMVLVIKPFKCGDWIELQGQAGTVMDIRLFNTILRTADNKTILLPNGSVFTGVVSNHTSARTRRLEWAVSLELDTDFEEVRKTLLDLLATDKRINSTPVPEVVMARLNPGSMDLLIHCWVGTADYWDVFYKMNAAIFKTLTDKGFDLESSQTVKVAMLEPQEKSTPNKTTARK